MPRNISFALTEPQFLDGSKTVTRRLGWRFLRPGDILMGVRKGMGLRPGEKIVRLGLIEVISVAPQLLCKIDQRDCVLEGFPKMTPREFIEFFKRSHQGCENITMITRIEFRHLSERPGLPLREDV